MTFGQALSLAATDLPETQHIWYNVPSYTGCDNALILHNLRLMSALGRPFVIRVPLVPGVTNTNTTTLLHRRVPCPKEQLVVPIPESLLEICTYSGRGYQPLIVYGTWRVAVLRYTDTLLPSNLDTMQRHNETDEVFVLLAGRCVLFIGEGDTSFREIYAQDMEPLKLYNVKKGCWHTHTLSPDATVLIVENHDTSALNSPRATLDAEQRAKIVELAERLWRE